jgi:acyl carrier protein
LKEILKVEGDVIDTELTFYDYGVDSISAVEIINRINESLQISLRTTDLFNYSLIKDLKNQIKQKFNKEVIKALGKRNVNDHSDVLAIADYNELNDQILDNSIFDVNIENIPQNKTEILKILKKLENGRHSADEVNKYFEKMGSKLFDDLN